NPGVVGRVKAVGDQWEVTFEGQPTEAQAPEEAVAEREPTPEELAQIEAETRDDLDEFKDFVEEADKRARLYSITRETQENFQTIRGAQTLGLIDRDTADVLRRGSLLLDKYAIDHTLEIGGAAEVLDVKNPTHLEAIRTQFSEEEIADAVSRGIPFWTRAYTHIFTDR
ncbi:hypothetical protein COS86_04255, partial [Candidatus Bathyarchaeota archaeon CG07_land_8_20_14_0_80_47_9]